MKHRHVSVVKFFRGNKAFVLFIQVVPLTIEMGSYSLSLVYHAALFNYKESLRDQRGNQNL